MQAVLEVVVAWVVLSCTLGPLLAWAFFYPERRAKANEAASVRSVVTHSVAPTLSPIKIQEDADPVEDRKISELYGALQLQGPRGELKRTTGERDRATLVKHCRGLT